MIAWASNRKLQNTAAPPAQTFESAHPPQHFRPPCTSTSADSQSDRSCDDDTRRNDDGPLRSASAHGPVRASTDDRQNDNGTSGQRISDGSDDTETGAGTTRRRRRAATRQSRQRATYSGGDNDDSKEPDETKHPAAKSRPQADGAAEGRGAEVRASTAHTTPPVQPLARQAQGRTDPEITVAAERVELTAAPKQTDPPQWSELRQRAELGGPAGPTRSARLPGGGCASTPERAIARELQAPSCRAG